MAITEQAKSGATDPVAGRHVGIPFEEYKMYYESTELVTDRRLALTRTNTSLCLLIAAGVGIVLGWSFDKQEILPLALIVAAVISVLASLFCRWWLNQLISYKDLNTAKFQVLSEMAPKVVFGGSPPEARSFLPFEKEWERLKEINALQKYKRTLALSASFSELIVPKSFIVFYVGTVFVCTFLFLSKHHYKSLIAFMF